MTTQNEIGLFDKFADIASRTVSRAPFFVACVLLVLVWTPSILIVKDIQV